GEAVITPTRVIQLRGRTSVRFLDEVFVDEPLERAVKRCRPEPYLTARAVEDFLHDAVTVLILVRERQQNMKPMRLQGQKTVGIGRLLGHLYRLLYISTKIESQSPAFDPEHQPRLCS